MDENKNNADKENCNPETKKGERQTLITKYGQSSLIGQVGLPVRRKIGTTVLTERVAAVSPSSSGDFVSSPEQNVKVRKRAESKGVSKKLDTSHLVENEIVEVGKQVITDGNGGDPKFRSNFKPVIALFDKIKTMLGPEHLRELHKSPFRHLILCFLNGHVKETHVMNYVSALREVTACFESKNKCFKFGEVEEKPNLNYFRCALGIEDGKTDVVISNHFNITEFYSRHPLFVARKATGIRMTSNVVKDQLLARLNGGQDKNSHEDVARLLTLYVMVAVVLTPPSGQMPWAWVEMLDNFKDFKNYNWSKCVMETTMNIFESDNKQYGGCPALLLFWLCENTNVIPCENSRFWPRILKWDLSKLSMLVSQKDINISTMTGFQWTGSVPICFCEWDKLGFPETSELPEECKHGGDTYIGEGIDVSDDDDGYTCTTEKSSDDYVIRSVDSMGNVSVKEIKLGELVTPEHEPTVNGVSDFLDEQGYVMENDDMEPESESDSMENTPVITRKSEVDTPAEISSRKSMEDESPACQKLFGWGVHKSLDKDAKRLDFEGIEKDEQQLCLDLFGAVEEETLDNSESLNEEYAAEPAIPRTIAGIDISNERSFESALEFYQRQQAIISLQSKIKVLEEELEYVNSECARIDSLEAELNSVKTENDKLKDQVMKCKCKKISLQPKLVKKNKRQRTQASGAEVMVSGKKPLQNQQTSEKLNSMVQRVKQRANRQKKRISGYTYHTESAKARKKRARRAKAISMDVSKTAAKPTQFHQAGEEGDISIDQRLVDAFYRLHDIRGPSAKVWQGTIAGDVVIAKEVDEVWKGGDVLDTVVNGWCEIQGEGNKKIRIFDAGCHGFIAHAKENDEFARMYLDPVLEEFRDCELLVFPLNSTGGHWTLLVLDLVQKKWLHYNSLLPILGVEDRHLENANIVKEYVENKILEIIARDKCGTEFEKCGPISSILDSPQQGPGTVDCGIFICIIMERLVAGRNPTAPISPALVSRYRRKMVRVFVERGLLQQ